MEPVLTYQTVKIAENVDAERRLMEARREAEEKAKAAAEAKRKAEESRASEELMQREAMNHEADPTSAPQTSYRETPDYPEAPVGTEEE
jgi:hypothetical protein